MATATQALDGRPAPPAAAALSPPAGGCSYRSQSSSRSGGSAISNAEGASEATGTVADSGSTRHTSSGGGGRWRAVLRLNAVQRCLSAAVLAPLVTYFLWVSPAFATTTVCSFIASVCSYEYAWLASRIRLRLFSRLRAVDCELFADDSEGVGDGIAASETTSSPSSPHMDCSGAEEEDEEEEEEEEEVDSEARMDRERLDQERRCAVSGVAARWFRGRTWVAAGAVSVPVCAAASALLLTLAEYIPRLGRTEFYAFRWFYAVATSYVASLSACLAPDAAYAAIVFAQNAVFTALTMHSTVCPINSFECGQSVSPAAVFGGSLLALALFRGATSRHRVAALLSLMLDALGFLYIVGSLSVLVAFVDDGRRSLYRKLLIALLYVVWASDSGAYATGKLLARLRYTRYTPLAAHLSRNKDYEGTAGAVAWGMAAMVAASHLLDVPGATGTKLLVAVLAVVVGRLGDLFESLLKRAAGVKDSGALIPGHGGVLDRIDALMFATLVFARYYALVVM